MHWEILEVDCTEIGQGGGPRKVFHWNKIPELRREQLEQHVGKSIHGRRNTSALGWCLEEREKIGKEKC